MPDPVENQENPKRFSPQCFLLDFYKSFVAHNKDTTYGNYVKINVEPSDVINRLLNKKSSFALNDLTPAQMSSLVPHFRLYKMYADGTEKEFYFSDHTSIENLGASGTKTKYNKYQDFNINSTNKPLAVGFESFSWEDLGTNPANQGLSFKASLSLIAPTMQSLFVKSKNGLSFDEIICPVERKKTSSNPEYDNKHNRLRADVGWKVPNSFETTPEIWGADSQTRNKIKNAIKASQVSLYLNLTSHELSIQEDGTIGLSVEFMASLEAGLFSPKSDLFYLGKIENQMIKNHQDKVKRLEQDRERRKKRKAELEKTQKKSLADRFLDSVTIGGYSELGGVEEAISNLDEQITEQKKIIADIEQEALLRKYSSLMTAIAKQGRFFSIQLTPPEMKAYKQLNELYKQRNLTSEEIQVQRRDIIKDLRLFNAHYRPNPSRNPPSTSADIASEISNAASRPVEQPFLKSIVIDNRQEQLNDAQENIQKPIDRARDPQNRVINYIYMGDLLEAAFGVVRKNQREDGDREDMIWRFLVGQIKIFDFEYQKYVNVNVADLPVCWEYFQSFFLDKVIKPGKKTYNIRRFVKDIISELLVGALSPICFGKMAPEARTKVNTQVLTLPSQGNPMMPIPEGGQIYSDGQIDGLVDWVNGTRASHNYLFVYPMGGTSYKWKGDYKEDQKNNILHLQIGADRGVLKGVSFERQDMPGQREANIQKTVDTGGAVGNLLFSNKYNASLTLYGNTFFTNGCTLYLDPRGLGIGGLNQPNSMAQKLGVGGYYNVTKVQNEIASGKFETQVTTILQGLGNEKNKKADTVTQAPPPIETCHSQNNCETVAPAGSTQPRMNDPKVRRSRHTGIQKYR